MKTKHKFLDSLLNNWIAKLVCIGAAVILFVVHRATLLEKKSFVIPLEVQTNGAVMPVSNIDKSITVTVRAYSEIISMIHASDIHAQLNLDALAKSGDFVVPVNLEVEDSLLSYNPLEIRAKPEYLKIKVEKKDVKYVSIEPSLVGEPEYGYEVSEIITDPTHVEVIGPESILKEIDKIYTEPVYISDLNKKVTSEVNYKEMNKMIMVTNKGPYKVTVDFSAKGTEKILTGIQINFQNLSEELYIEDSEHLYDLNITGNVPDLEKLVIPNNIINVDCSSITEEGEYELPVIYDLPSHIKLKEIPFETIKIKVLKKSEEGDNQEE
ncbi:MAG: hypothetical protein IKX23_11635 [Treponema sp.]|nr:hypothetical protein [Treponema sp.]